MSKAAPLLVALPCRVCSSAQPWDQPRVALWPGRPASGQHGGPSGRGLRQDMHHG